MPRHLRKCRNYDITANIYTCTAGCRREVAGFPIGTHPNACPCGKEKSFRSCWVDGFLEETHFFLPPHVVGPVGLLGRRAEPAGVGQHLCRPEIAVMLRPTDCPCQPPPTPPLGECLGNLNRQLASQPRGSRCRGTCPGCRPRHHCCWRLDTGCRT
jgi:hypothetical protein